MIIGVDIGGTFTDFVVFDGALHSFKLPSTPGSPEAAVLQGLQRVGLTEGVEVVHGSTVATNAVLERRGARTALITTEGLRDVLSIGRQNRSDLYDLNADRSEPLVPGNLCFEVRERLDHRGEVLTPLQADALPRLLAELQRSGAESVAVCLLFSFLNDEHEMLVGAALRPLGIPISLSSQVLPEFREYERASTTVLNAYVAPVMSRYLQRLETGIGLARLRIMQSNGGSLSAKQAGDQPVRAILSGPAGGVVGAVAVARAGGFDQVMTFDMGGTSTDVSLSTGIPSLTSEGEIDGLPLRLPMIDIHTVGSGGGSIAVADPGGSLRVGPQSAGAEPGPACYGKGGSAATVTDANLVLGRIDPDQFLGGEMALDSQVAWSALDRLGSELGFAAGAGRACHAAMGVVRIANAHMARALRVVSVTRGHDPREFTLVSFGGAGGLHACEVARSVGIRKVLVPPNASTLSAYGMIVAEIKRDYVRTVMLEGSTPYGKLLERMAEIEQLGRQQIEQEGVVLDQIAITRQLDLRYAGQAYELNLPLTVDWQEQFHAAHEREYGYSDPSLPVQIVNLRVEAVGMRLPPEAELPITTADQTGPHMASVFIGTDTEQSTEIPSYAGDSLPAETHLVGPALISYSDTTVLLGEKDSLRVDAQRNLVIEVAPA